MFECSFPDALYFKKVIDAIRDLIVEANLDINCGGYLIKFFIIISNYILIFKGISIQAMDSSHVSLVRLELKADLINKYRVDRTITLGLNLASLSKILKFAGSKDCLNMEANESGDTLTFLIKSTGKFFL